MIRSSGQYGLSRLERRTMRVPRRISRGAGGSRWAYAERLLGDPPTLRTIASYPPRARHAHRSEQLKMGRPRSGGPPLMLLLLAVFGLAAECRLDVFRRRGHGTLGCLRGDQRDSARYFVRPYAPVATPVNCRTTGTARDERRAQYQALQGRDCYDRAVSTEATSLACAWEPRSRTSARARRRFDGSLRVAPAPSRREAR